MKKAKCLVCNKQFTYNEKIQKGYYCSIACRYEDYGNIIAKSYNEKLRKKRSEDAKKQMKDPKQIQIRKEKCGKGMTDEVRKKISDTKLRNEFLKVKKQLIKENGPFCERCGKRFELSQLVGHHKDGRQWVNDEENIQILCKSCHSKIHNEINKISNKFAGLATVENHIARVLQDLGVDLNEPDFRDTPLRVARMYNDLFESCKVDLKEEKNKILDTKFPCDNDNMVVVKDIRVYSLCPHHLVPVEYDIAIGYIPKKYVLGLSKLVRISELFAKRPVLQETMTVEIANAIQEGLKPVGVAVFVKGKHYCMVMRGVKQKDSKTTTSHLIGVFKDPNDTSRAEFLRLISL
jgi:GTP cyclohydrolase I